MRIVVFSDSHNNYFALQRIVLSQPSAELFLHLGDGEREFQQLTERFPGRLMRGVAGNCDWGSLAKVQDTIRCGGKKIYITHGHLLGVKAGIESFLQIAKREACDIALFGHTHVAYTGYHDGMYVMNPGSVSGPKPSYGFVDITDAGIVTHIVVR